MRELRLTAVSEDGSHLILSDGDEQFALRADERLHAAIRGDRARLGQLEIQLESQLRPRDIQARVRAGESVESVAAAATMPVDKVRRFAGPVLAEREHIAERARQSNLRRSDATGPVCTLETAAADYAASIGSQPDTLEWDAWRADDGRWRVRCTWSTPDEHDASVGATSGGDTDASASSALFSFDPTGRWVSAYDDTAHVVAGDPRPEPAAPEPADDVPGPARLSVVHSRTDDDPPDDDSAADGSASALEQEPGATASPVGPVASLVSTDGPQVDEEAERTAPLEPVARRSRRSGRYGRGERRRRDAELWNDEPSQDDDATTDRLHLSDIASHVEVDEPAAETGELAPTAQEAPPAPRPRSSSRSRRPSVPSWDEIMFGRRKEE